jgi:ribonuclease Z
MYVPRGDWGEEWAGGAEKDGWAIMSIDSHILGAAGRDNAVLLYLHTGQAVVRLLFDCGDACLAGLPFAEIQRIDGLFFSHLHMDHIGGFDAFFRCTYNRTLRPNVIWGPPETARILQHRFQGFLWNLHGGHDAQWRVADVHPDHLDWTRFELAEAFAHAHPDGAERLTGRVRETPDYTVEAIHLDHLTPSLGYLVRERPRLNIDVSRLGELGVSPGPWLKDIKTAPAEQTHLDIDGTRHSLAALRALLLTETPGASFAYLTDFRLDAATRARLVPWLQGCTTLVCESAYRQAEHALAAQNAHLTTAQAATLAAEAGVGKLILIHLSERYPPEEWPALLAEAQAVFPATHFPKEWGLG